MKSSTAKVQSKTTRTSDSPRFAAILSWLRLWVPLALLASIPILSDYLLNSYQLSIQEILLPLLLNLVVSLIVASVFYLMWRRDRVAATITSVLLTIVLVNNYDARLQTVEPILRTITPLPSFGGGDYAIYSLVFLIGLAIGMYWFGRLMSWLVKLQKWNGASIVTAITIAITVTFGIQFVSSARDLLGAWPQFFYHPPKLAAAPATAKTAAKPDIYYIVLDRYASPQILSSQFNFDDSDFTNFLASDGFYVHDDAHQNYPYTAMSIASTMTANYNSDIINKFGNSQAQTTIPYNLAIRNSAVAQYLKSLGYQYDLIGNWYETSNTSPLANTIYQPEGLLTVFGKTLTLDNFAKNELTQGIFWRFLPTKLPVGKVNVLGYSNADIPQMTDGQLKDLKSLAAAKPGQRFIFAHILVPHDPYFFNADGSINPNPDGNNVGEPIKQKYVNQVKYINSQMEQVLTQIKANSHGQAVVILQSDEGPYPIDLNDQDFDFNSIQDELATGSMLNWSTADLQMKFGNFAAYNVPGASQGDLVNGGTSVNAFRLVFNTLFNQGMPYLADCYYAFPNGRAAPFNYQNINKQLTGQTNSVCSDDGTDPK